MRWRGQRQNLFGSDELHTNLTRQERLNYESVRVDLRFAEQAAAGVMGVVFNKRG